MLLDGVKNRTHSIALLTKSLRGQSRFSLRPIEAVRNNIHCDWLRYYLSMPLYACTDSCMGLWCLPMPDSGAAKLGWDGAGWEWV